MQAVTIFSEPFDNGIGDFTIENKTLPSGLSYVWRWQNAQYGMVASAYVSGTKYATESWLISPPISLKDFEVANHSQLSFDHAVNKGTPSALSVKISEDDGATWKDLNIKDWPAGTDWNFVHTTVHLGAYMFSTIRIAFCYVSSSAVAPQWEIKNFKITTTSAKVKVGDLYYMLMDESNGHFAVVVSEYANSDENYSGLTTVDIPSVVEYDGATYDVSIGYNAFNKCKSLTSVTIPNTITIIPEGAFRECTGLTSVTIPNSVTSIGSSAFHNCSSLTSVTIPNSVTSIEGRAFEYCSGLTSIEIPNSVTSIGDYAFLDCTSLTSIEIPNSVTSIRNDAFHGCSSLTSVTIPNSVTSIGGGAFLSCRGLTSVTIPNSVTSIGDYAFGICTGLTSVTIPNSVTSIGENAFYLVPNIVYSGSATGSPWGARSMNGFVDGFLVYTDASKTTLLACSAAVQGEIVIPNSVTSIGISAFSYCSGLTSIICEATTPPTCATVVSSDVFWGVDQTIPLYVPAESVEAYKAADVWKEFSNIRAIGDIETAVENVPSDQVPSTKAQKILRNGQIYILRGEKVYSITGQEVK